MRWWPPGRRRPASERCSGAAAAPGPGDSAEGGVGVRIRYLGTAAVEVHAGGLHVLIDPYITANRHCPLEDLREIAPVDLVLVTHGAKDHLGDAIELVQRDGASLVCPPDVKILAMQRGVPAERIFIVVSGVERRFGSLALKAVKADHLSLTTLGEGAWVTGQPVGYLLFAEGRTVYHTGDTSLFGDLRLIGEFHRPDLAFLPIGMAAAGAITEMNPEEAAVALSWVQARACVPMHYDPETQADYPQRFRTLAAQKAPEARVVLLAPGEGMDL
jgi:L-ascorbate metabolism protein UlaG (beta-lactamase superfamily)